jgi:hypothetical protein
MIKSIGKITLAGILAAVVMGMPVTVSAQSTNKSVPSIKVPDVKGKPVPFHGKVASVDKSAKTVTLDDKNKRTFHVTSETKIMKNEKPATLDDVTVGEDIRGSYKKNDDQTMSLRSLYIGTKPEAAPKKKTETK